MCNAEKQGMLSLDAKLIAATNMAVAKAIWDTYHAERGGQPARTSETLVLGSVKEAMKHLDEIVKEIAADAVANPKEVGLA